MHSFGLVFIILIQCSIALASEGDASAFYKNCVKSCMTANCTDGGGFTKEASQMQDSWSRMLLWDCQDECQYHCMWRTVAGFNERWKMTPKFHGKWPFIRILGIQEPASALFSWLNLASHVYMHSKIRREFRGDSVPLLWFWHAFVAVCVNGWMWSTIFHTRDTPFTEFMDYACALSMIMALFAAAVIRVFGRRLTSSLVLLAAALCYAQHVRYLYTGRVDYTYNMRVNVAVGVVSAVIWLGWALPRYLRGQRYLWRCVAFMLLSGALVTLETADFPPAAALLDAHALWHLSTAPLPLLFYRFVIDDLRYLQTTATAIPEKIGIKLS